MLQRSSTFLYYLLPKWTHTMNAVLSAYPTHYEYQIRLSERLDLKDMKISYTSKDGHLFIRFTPPEDKVIKDLE